MHDAQRKVYEVIEELRRRGWKVRGDTARHFMAFPPDPTKRPVVFAASPSDRRAWLNIRASLRRSGADWL